jgi:hypothetical protein
MQNQDSSSTGLINTPETRVHLNLSMQDVVSDEGESPNNATLRNVIQNSAVAGTDYMGQRQ